MLELLEENTIFSNTAERDALKKDHAKLKNLFWINSLGFFALRKKFDSNTMLKKWFSGVDKTKINEIQDDSHDMAITLKLAHEENIVPNNFANDLAMLIYRMKTSPSLVVDEDKLRVMFKKITFSSARPSPQIATSIEEWLDGKIDLEALVFPLYYFAKYKGIADDFQGYSKYFYKTIARMAIDYKNQHGKDAIPSGDVLTKNKPLPPIVVNPAVSAKPILPPGSPTTSIRPILPPSTPQNVLKPKSLILNIQRKDLESIYSSNPRLVPQKVAIFTLNALSELSLDEASSKIFSILSKNELKTTLDLINRIDVLDLEKRSLGLIDNFIDSTKYENKLFSTKIDDIKKYFDFFDNKISMSRSLCTNVIAPLLIRFIDVNSSSNFSDYVTLLNKLFDWKKNYGPFSGNRTFIGLCDDILIKHKFQFINGIISNSYRNELVDYYIKGVGKVFIEDLIYIIERFDKKIDELGDDNAEYFMKKCLQEIKLTVDNYPDSFGSYNMSRIFVNKEKFNSLVENIKANKNLVDVKEFKDLILNLITKKSKLEGAIPTDDPSYKLKIEMENGEKIAFHSTMFDIVKKGWMRISQDNTNEEFINNFKNFYDFDVNKLLADKVYNWNETKATNFLSRIIIDLKRLNDLYTKDKDFLTKILSSIVYSLKTKEEILDFINRFPNYDEITNDILTDIAKKTYDQLGKSYLADYEILKYSFLRMGASVSFSYISFRDYPKLLYSLVKLLDSKNYSISDNYIENLLSGDLNEVIAALLAYNPQNYNFFDFSKFISKNILIMLKYEKENNVDYSKSIASLFFTKTSMYSSGPFLSAEIYDYLINNYYDEFSGVIKIRYSNKIWPPQGCSSETIEKVKKIVIESFNKNNYNLSKLQEDLITGNEIARAIFESLPKEKIKNISFATYKYIKNEKIADITFRESCKVDDKLVGHVVKEMPISDYHWVIETLIKDYSSLVSSRIIQDVINASEISSFIHKVEDDINLTSIQKEDAIQKALTILGNDKQGRSTRILNSMFNERGVGNALNDVRQNSLIPILKNVSPKDVGDILKFNNFSLTDLPDELKYRPSKKVLDWLKEARKYEPELPPLKVTESNITQEQYERMSIEYYDKYSNGKHGKIAAKFIKSFDVNLVTPEMEKWKADHPNPILVPAFHGTGSIAASMVLRFGFKVVTQSIGGVSVVGKMLGNGVYFAQVLDKSLQYIGDDGYARRNGTKGYILECEVYLGEEGEFIGYKDYKSAYNTISPEWCVYKPREQIWIKKAHLVELSSVDYIDDLKDRYKDSPIKEEYFKVKTFKDYYQITEEKDKMDSVSVSNFVFYDGTVPYGEEQLDFDEFMKNFKDSKKVMLGYSQHGPEITIYHNKKDLSGFYMVPSTLEMMRYNPEGIYEIWKSLIS